MASHKNPSPSASVPITTQIVIRLEPADIKKTNRRTGLVSKKRIVYLAGPQRLVSGK